LDTALKTVCPQTVGGFRGLMYLQINRELTDHYRKYYGPEGIGSHYQSSPGNDGSSDGPLTPGDWNAGPSTENPASQAEHAARLSQLREAISLLADKTREVVLLRLYENLEHTQIADLLKVSTITVKRAWADARLSLGKMLEDSAGGT
jgi:RNA polymerase sigma factor (sigma-70 family)